MRAGVFAFLAALLMTASSNTANAAASSGTISVHATVISACSVADATVPFGTVAPTSGVAGATPISLAVTCSLATPFSVGLGDGLYGTAGARRMKRSGSSDYLTYNLYKDATVSSRFGDTGSADRAAGVGQGAAVTPVSVYATVPANQAAPSGSYADTVEISVYY